MERFATGGGRLRQRQGRVVRHELELRERDLGRDERRRGQHPGGFRRRRLRQRQGRAGGDDPGLELRERDLGRGERGRGGRRGRCQYQRRRARDGGGGGG